MAVVQLELFSDTVRQLMELVRLLAVRVGPDGVDPDNNVILVVILWAEMKCMYMMQ